VRPRSPALGGRGIALALAVALATGLCAAPAGAAPTGEPVDLLDPAQAPGAVRRTIFRAETARQADDLAGAVRMLAEALAADPGLDHAALRYRLGALLLESGDPGAALAHLRAACDAAPAAPAAWRERGRAAYEMGAYAEAAAAFAQSLRVGAAEPELGYYAGAAWLLADRPDSALAALAPLMASVPDTVPLAWVQALVAAAVEAGTPDRAAVGVERLLREQPDRAAAWRLASQQAQCAGDLAAATVRLQTADWLAPLARADLLHLAELQAAAGAPRLAARTYARLWGGGPGDTTLVAPLAAAWLAAHEPDSARGTLQAALAARPDARWWELLGDLEYAEAKWEAASAACGRAVATDPDRGRAWFMLGASEAQAGRDDLAVEHLERAAADPAVADQARRMLDQLSRR